MGRPKGDICQVVFEHSVKLADMVAEHGDSGSDMAANLRRKMSNEWSRMRGTVNHRDWRTARDALVRDCRRLRQLASDFIRGTRTPGVCRGPGDSDRMAGFRLREAGTRVMRLDSRLGSLLIRFGENKPPAVYFGCWPVPAAGFMVPYDLRHRGEGARPPGERLRIDGPKDLEVRVSIRHVRGCGGHRHDVGTDPRYVGTFQSLGGLNYPLAAKGGSAISFRLRGEGAAAMLQYRATDFCGRFEITVDMGHYGTRRFYIQVRYAGELIFLDDHPHEYLRPYTHEKTVHPDSRYGTPGMIRRLHCLADEFGAACRAREFGDPSDPRVPSRLHINDLSLEWGGTFKVDGRMNGNAHETHKWGRDVDISYNLMNNNKKLIAWFWEASRKYFIPNLHDADKPYRHWHCELL